MAVGGIVLILVIVGAFAWLKFGPQSNKIISASEAGLGKPMHPGEIPGQRGPTAPMLGNVPTKQ
jgi:hypothetical protein